MKQILQYLIIGVLLFAIYGAFGVSMEDFKQKDVCPKIFGIPACYVVLSFFLIALLAQILRHSSGSRILFYIVVAIPFLMALSGTIKELSGTVICPRTSGGTPMCYISLGLCTALLLLKTFFIIGQNSIIKY